jgi:NADPH-ferrihemoprotein reductase
MSPSVLSCYSTQSGTSKFLAEKFAATVNDVCGGNGWNLVCDLINVAGIPAVNEMRETFSKYEIVVFFISTFGEGEPCDDSIEFFNHIKELDGDSRKYSLFGCGNSFYDKYQEAAIELKTLLDASGWIQVGEFGKSNEANNSIVDDYSAWLFDYMPVLGKELCITLKHIDEYRPMYLISRAGLGMKAPASRPPYQEFKPFRTNIAIESVVEYGENYVQFDVNLSPKDSRLKYQAGDHIGIYPQNSQEDVAKMLQIVDTTVVTGKIKLMPVNRMESNRLTNKTYESYEELFEKYVEINGVLSRALVKDIAIFFIKNIELKHRILDLVNSKEKFLEEITKNKLTLVKFFEKYAISGPHCDLIPVSFIVENFGYLKPRYFSIASSETVSNDRATVIMKLIREEMGDYAFNGVCSSFIRRILAGKSENQIEIYLRKSKFKLPYDIGRPMVFIGAGTGMAPYRGFLQDLCSSPAKTTKVSKIIVLYGLRAKNSEYWLYSSDIERFQATLGEKLEVHYAVSMGEDGSPKQYVQDLLAASSPVKGPRDTLEQLIDVETKQPEKQMHLYVCGDAAGMAPAVDRALIALFSSGKPKDIKKGHQRLQRMASLGRYSKDVW